jgi:hypothetical protein
VSRGCTPALGHLGRIWGTIEIWKAVSVDQVKKLWKRAATARFFYLGGWVTAGTVNELAD